MRPDQLKNPAYFSYHHTRRGPKKQYRQKWQPRAPEGFRWVHERQRDGSLKPVGAR